jgi:hypothetical protein
VRSFASAAVTDWSLYWTESVLCVADTRILNRTIIYINFQPRKHSSCHLFICAYTSEDISSFQVKCVDISYLFHASYITFQSRLPVQINASRKFHINCSPYVVVKGKAFPLQVMETQAKDGILGFLPYFHIRHNSNGRVASCTRRPHFTLQEILWYSFV